MFIMSPKIFHRIERCFHYLNNLTIVATLFLAFFWVVLGKSDLEAWIALLGITSIILSKTSYILEKLGYDKDPLGKGVLSKGCCWIRDGKEEFKIKLSADVDRLKTKIDYIPSERVMAHIIDGYLIFKRREGDSGHKIRVDYELIDKN